jgi:hypothetical protein
MATVIYNCKRCKAGKRVEYPIERRKGYFFRLDSNGNEQPSSIWIQACGGGRPVEYGGDIEMGICRGCGKMMESGVLKGFFKPDHKCDARCMSSRGPLCECACGGANHGRAA